ERATLRRLQAPGRGAQTCCRPADPRRPALGRDRARRRVGAARGLRCAPEAGRAPLRGARNTPGRRPMLLPRGLHPHGALARRMGSVVGRGAVVAGHHVALLRTTAYWVARAARQRGTLLEPTDRAALQRLREQLTSAPCAADDDIREAIALIDVLLVLGVKVEQERY